jgi:hypothetical protein
MGMIDEDGFDDINRAKANLDHIYNRADPRAYFRELGKLDYGIPGAAKPIFQALIAHLQPRSPEPLHVLDLGCSYGVNAALLKCDMTMLDLYERWGRPQQADAAPEQVLERDRRYFDGRDQAHDLKVIGLDQAGQAVAFGEETGLLDGGIVANLETRPLSDQAEQDLAPVELIISTGCVGYVTEKSFDRLLPAVSEGRPPWIANFVLRMFPFDTIAGSLSGWGYVTEKLDGQTFAQRRFFSDDEQDLVLDQLQDQGVDPSGKEAEGQLHAEFFLSRPAREAAELPLSRLVAA